MPKWMAAQTFSFPCQFLALTLYRVWWGMENGICVYRPFRITQPTCVVACVFYMTQSKEYWSHTDDSCMSSYQREHLHDPHRPATRQTDCINSGQSWVILLINAWLSTRFCINIFAVHCGSLSALLRQDILKKIPGTLLGTLLWLLSLVSHCWMGVPLNVDLFRWAGVSHRRS